MNAPTNIQRTSPSRRHTSSLLLTFVAALFAAIVMLLVAVDRTDAQAQGEVWAWGLNNFGELGDGTNTDSNTPVQVSNLSDVKAIAGGYHHSLALKNDGTVWAWGHNGVGQLGNGTNTDSNTPVQVSNLSDIKAIGAGEYYSLALKNDGTVWAWGHGGDGQLGNGTNTNSNTPVQVSNLSDIKAIGAGDFHSLALKNDGTVWAWGYNSAGQLGDGTNTDSNTPVQVSNLSGVQAVAGGIFHSLALKNDGTVWAWGYNSFGQLGNSTTIDSNTPVQVSNLSGVQAVADCGYHSLALKNDGTVWAWGHNGRGQLGGGATTIISNTPVQVSNLSDIKAIGAGAFHSLALKNDGTVWAWGENGGGELGNGTNTDSNTPVQVSSLSGVQAIAAGYDHSLAVTSSGAPGDTTAPKVISTSPKANANEVAPAANVRATFSEEMRPASVKYAFKLFKKGTTTQIAAQVSYNADTDTAKLDPTNTLGRGVAYKAVVTTWAKDVAGNRLDQDSSTAGLQQKRWCFRVDD
jgi:alpha-tubulin suppressor-like RCC1 family protein